MLRQGCPCLAERWLKASALGPFLTLEGERRHPERSLTRVPSGLRGLPLGGSTIQRGRRGGGLLAPSGRFWSGQGRHRPSNPAPTAGMFDASPLSPGCWEEKELRARALREGRSPCPRVVGRREGGVRGGPWGVSEGEARPWYPPVGVPGREGSKRE